MKTKNLNLKFTVKELRALRYAVDILNADYTDKAFLSASARKTIQAAERADFKLAAALRESQKQEKENELRVV